MRTAWQLALCGTLLVPVPALAHAPPQATGIAWSSSVAVTRLLVRTNRGLLVSDNGGPLRLLCNDAYAAALSETVPYLSTGSGLMLASYAGGLQRGSADLCQFDPVPVSFAHKTLADLTGSSDRALYALTLPTDTEPAQVWKADEAGEHFVAGATSATFGASLRVAPGDSNTLYASQLDLSDPSAPVPQVAVSHDAGLTFESHLLELSAAEFRSFVLGVDPRDAKRVFVRTDTGDSTAAQRLLLSEDGGSSWSTVFSGVGPLSLAIDESNAVVWVGGYEGLFRSDDNGRHFQAVAENPLNLIGCLVIHDGALYACGYSGEFGVFVSRDGGRIFQPFVRFPQVTEAIQCPPDSQVAQSCAGTFEDWALEQSELEHGPLESADPESQDAALRPVAGGCRVAFARVGGGTRVSALLLALFGAAARRRAARRQRRLAAPV